MRGLQKIVAFIGTRDPARAREFYGGALGLRTISEDHFAVVFDAGGTTLRVTHVPEVTAAPYTVLGWEVADIAEAVKDLEGSGVRLERFGSSLHQDELGIWTAPGGARVAWFKDPDGNLLSITQF